MKVLATSSFAAALLLAGCATVPAVTNPSGQPVKFVEPILGKAGMQNAKYVLLEKSIADGRYTVVSFSASRQPITNDRQERIAFNADLTGFAPDYVDTSFRTHVDSGNYDQKTVITTCDAYPLKTQHYSPCNSEFGEQFIPTGVTKAYVAGQVSAEAMKGWRDPARNRTRFVTSPNYALAQAGVFTRLAELAAVK